MTTRPETFDSLSLAGGLPSPRLPFDLFTTSQFQPGERFDAWRESIGVVFDVSPSTAEAKKDFKASVCAYKIGDLFVSKVDFGAQHFVRGGHKIAVDGLDHYLVQLYDDGGFAGNASGRDLIVAPGDVQILDMGRPHASAARRSRTVAIVVPRDTLHAVLPDGLDLHGVVLRGEGGRGGILADYFKSLVSRLDSISMEEGQLLRHATVNLIAACFHPTADNLARAETQLAGARLDRIKRYISANLGTPGLSPEMLCRQFRLSRAHLYRIFEPLGGVAEYVLFLRLARAQAELSDPMQSQRRIFEIAYDLGFSSEAYFSRAFRKAYGQSPSEVRASIRASSSAAAAITQNRSSVREGYEDWLRSLGRASSG